MDYKNKKENLILWIGLSIPIIALIFVAIFAYVPSNFTAEYDFLYYLHNDNSDYYYCIYDDIYFVKNQKIMITSITDDIDFDCKSLTISDLPKIYRYDVSSDERTVLSFTEATSLRLDNSKLSPDFMSIDNGDYNDMGIFGIFGSSNNYSDLYLKNNKDKMKKINTGSGGYYDFNFIGWVLK